MRHTPGRAWVWARRAAQCVALVVIALAPLLGGWQRGARSDMGMWASDGFDLRAGARDELPRGEAADRAYDALVLAGGGAAVDYLGLPAVDPVAGAGAALRGALSLHFALALAVPIVFAVVAGRFFCGWLCPFGTLSRVLEAGLARLRWPRRALAIPRRRPLRWAVLGATLAASALGAHVAVFVFLPHLLVQQSVYATWLLGGGGAILGLLLGLVLAGIAFGPTAYCAALCPTGAALSAGGHVRVVRVTLDEPATCGSHCTLCSNACWLQLDPASGDPGPDCDACARCFRACPRANLRVVAGERPARRRGHLPVIAGALAAVALTAGSARADALPKPRLVLDGEVTRGGVTVAVSIVDLRGVSLSTDWAPTGSVEVSVYVSRGDGDVYTGPLEVELAGGVLRFDRPTSPISTPRRSIYRRAIDVDFDPGDRVAVRAVPGWLDEPVSFRVPPAGVAPSWWTTLRWTAVGALVFGGLLAVALALPHSLIRAPGSAAPGEPPRASVSASRSSDR